MGRVATARLAALALTALGVFGGRALRESAPVPERAVDLTAIETLIRGRTARDVEISERVREQLRSDAVLLRSYEREGEPPVWLYVDYHRRQRLGATVHSPIICYPGAGWSVERRQIDRIASADRTWPVRWLDLRRGEEEMVAVYWYETRWGRSARELGLKAAIVRSALARGVSDAALVRISSPVAEGGREAARERVLEFVEAARHPIARALPFEAPS